ncbi:hypothetical protein [Aestuariirhabdus sp. LZHN29]|uniref:hypothetical protein n=1 Tax=Aestuariirhabdus sp. LZHN29 TaxID=3417462 RepID=UPI003CF19AB3
MSEHKPSADEVFVSNLYQQMPAEEPGAELDGRIMSAARERAAGVKLDSPLARWRRWQWPASAAATVALGSLIYLYQMPSIGPEFQLDDAPLPSRSQSVSPAAESELGGETMAVQEEGQRVLENMPPAAAMKRKAAAAPDSIPLPAPSVADSPAAGSAREPSLMAPKAVQGAGAGAVMTSPADSARRQRLPTAAIGIDAAAGIEEKAEFDSRAEQLVPEESPQVWLARIQRLLDAGDKAAAGQAFAEFRFRYPDYPVEDELLRALP